MRWLIHAGIVAAMYAAAWPFLRDLLPIVDMPVPPSLRLLVALSAVANLVVIVYHYTVPPHPKFLMVPWRRAILRVHITSGTVELFAGLWALQSPSPVAAQVMAISALCFHVPSAFLQTPIVFGAQAVMRPGYLMCIGLHAFCAAKLLQSPGSAYWVAATFLVFNVYVWCRIYYYLFDKVGLFSGARYSVSILAAGLTTTPAVLGPNAIVVLGLGCAVYMVLVRFFFAREPGQWSELVRERARDSALPDELRALFGGARASDQADALAFFKHLDTDGDGALVASEVRQLLVDMALPPLVVDRFLEASPEGRFDFQRFFERLWPMNEVRERAFIVRGLKLAKSERDKAELVFQRLDVDGDGRLSRLELEALLREWSMPPNEVDRWLQRTGTAQQGFVDFAAFHQHLRPVWRFIFYDVVEAQHGRREDMIVRALTAARDDSAQAQVRQAVVKELAQKVPFLAEGGPALLEALSVSLAEEKLAAGQVLFAEGAPGDTFYLVRSGHLRVSRGEERLAELGPGDYVGEGALLTLEPRSATVTAVDDVALLTMTRGSFRALVEQHPALARAVSSLHTERYEERRLKALHQAMQIELLGKVPFLARAGAPLLAELAQALQREPVAEGAVIFKEAEEGDAFYLIGQGTIRIVRGEEIVAELGAGSWFGEGALLSGDCRSASAVAATGAVLYVLPRATFDWLLAAHPAAEEAIRLSHHARRTALVRGLLERSLLRKVPFLRLSTPPLLDALVGCLKPSFAELGKVIVTEGEPGDALYLIVKGAVRVEKGGAPLAELCEGSFFGERALLDDSPRSATVVALEDTELLALPKESVEQLALQWPELKVHLTQPPPRPSRPRAGAAVKEASVT